MGGAPLLSALLLLAPAPASAAVTCPTDWRARKTGDCVWRTGAITGVEEDFYVHPGGWLVRKNCHDRFGYDAFNEALTGALNKMKGGCMSRYNPSKGDDWVRYTWNGPFIVTCDDKTGGDACASNSAWPIPGQGSAKYQLISVKRADLCMGGDTTGLSGILFHETLHALSVSRIARHNTPDQVSQAEFIKDQVYGAEAVCYYGADAKTRKYVSYFQCFDLTDGDPKNVCGGFSRTVSDFLPAGLNKGD